MAYNGISDDYLGEIRKRNQKTVSTINNNQKKVQAQQKQQPQNDYSTGTTKRGNKYGGDSYDGGYDSGSSSKFSVDTYNRYENEYANWQKTGKNSAGYSTWGNQKDYDIWKQIRSGKMRTAQVGGDIYYMDNDTYKR